MKVRLYTKAGGLVHEQGIPPFKEPPDVIVFGARVFVCPDVSGPVSPLAAEAPDDTHLYEEAFTYVLPSPTTDAGVLHLSQAKGGPA